MAGSQGTLFSGGLAIAQLSQWQLADLPGQRRFQFQAMGVLWLGVGEHRLGGELSLELPHPKGVWRFRRAKLEGRVPLQLTVEEFSNER